MVEFRRGDIIEAGGDDWHLTGVAVQADDVILPDTVIVCPILKVDAPLSVRERVWLPRGAPGIGRPAEVLVDEPITLDTSDIHAVRGRLGRTYLEAVDHALFVVLDLYSSLRIPMSFQ